MLTAPTAILSSSGRRWQWYDQWAALPVPERGSLNRRTHGVTVLENGNVMVFHQAIPAMLTYSPQGELLGRWGMYPGAHGLTRVRRDGRELLWITDEFLGIAELVDLDGRVVLRLEKPDHPVYQQKTFVPTWVAEDSLGGKPSRIWLADGYGGQVVHAYDGEGAYEFTLTGEEGAGAFACPHGIAVDPRPGREGQLLIADRGNKRVQEYDRNGGFLGSWGSDFFHSPNGFDFQGGSCLVSELFGRVTLLDSENRPTEYLGDQCHARFLTGWPEVWRDGLLTPGLFNSPHSAAWGPNGEIYVVEWIRQGRVTKLIADPTPAREGER